MPNLSAVVTPLTETQVAPKFEYFTVPELDLYDQPHPGYRINRDSYGPGTHKISPPVAAELRTLEGAFNRYQMRLVQPRKDTKALNAVDRGRGVVAQTQAQLDALGA